VLYGFHCRSACYNVSLRGQDYATALDLMQELILSTDVAEHVKVIREIEQMVEGLWKLHS